VYDSAMGKTERFVLKTQLPCVKIRQGLIIDEPFVLVTYTTGHAEIPPTTLDFLSSNHELMLGVASSGHKNWGKDMFGKAGDKVADMYKVPLIHKFEMSGFPSDVEKFKKGVLDRYDIIS
jgi:protein involved in ribonucleotide reduction